MTLVEAIQNLTQIVTQMAQAQQGQQQGGMTEAQAQQLAQLVADNADLRERVAGLQNSQGDVIGALTTHTEQLAGLAQQLEANGRADQALRDVIGDTSALGAQP